MPSFGNWMVGRPSGFAALLPGPGAVEGAQTTLNASRMIHDTLAFGNINRLPLRSTSTSPGSIRWSTGRASACTPPRSAAYPEFNLSMFHQATIKFEPQSHGDTEENKTLWLCLPVVRWSRPFETSRNCACPCQALLCISASDRILKFGGSHVYGTAAEGSGVSLPVAISNRKGLPSWLTCRVPSSGQPVTNRKRGSRSVRICSAPVSRKM